MKSFTIKDLFKIIPFEDNERNELLAEFDSYSDALKFEVQQICWNAYDELFEQQTELKFQKIMLEVEAGIRPIHADLMHEAQLEVQQDMEDIISGKREEVQQMEDIRSKLQQLIQESKKTIK